MKELKESIDSIDFNKKHVYIASKKVIQPILVRASEYSAEVCRLEHIDFMHMFEFEDVDLSSSIVFNKCTFFENVLLNGIIIKLKEKGKKGSRHRKPKIIFFNCTFNGLVEFVGFNDENDGGAEFRGCIFNAYINFYDGTFKHIHFTLCVFKDSVSLTNIVLSEGIYFKKDTFENSLTLIRIKEGSINILFECTFAEPIEIVECTISTLDICDATVKKAMRLALNSINVVILSRSEFHRAVTITYQENENREDENIRIIDNYHIANCNFMNGIFINGSTDIFLNPNPRINAFNLDVTADLKGEIVLRNLYVTNLSMTGYNANASIMLNNLYVTNINIKNFINNSTLIFNGVTSLNIDSESEVNVQETNFGKAQFFQSDFSHFSRVNFHNVILTEISTSVTKWFTPNKTNFKEENEKVKLVRNAKEVIWKDIFKEELNTMYENNKEIYRQLKFVAQRQGDITSSLEFHRWEMMIYRKYIKANKSFFSSERLILELSRTNDFGQNWIKAVGFLIASSIFFYIPIVLILSPSIDHTQFATSWEEIINSLNVIRSETHILFTLLLPTHRISDLAPIDKLSNWVYFLDIFSRIFISFFVFQVISAFRKYGKKD